MKKNTATRIGLSLAALELAFIAVAANIAVNSKQHEDALRATLDNISDTYQAETVSGATVFTHEISIARTHTKNGKLCLTEIFRPVNFTASEKIGNDLRITRCGYKEDPIISKFDGPNV